VGEPAAAGDEPAIDALLEEIRARLGHRPGPAGAVRAR